MPVMVPDPPSSGDYVLRVVAGTMSWVAADRLRGPEGPQGKTGDRGPAGPPGRDGRDAPRIKIEIDGDCEHTTGGGSTGGGSTVATNKILSGFVAPAADVGANGDFYIDLTARVFYGPKASGSWPVGFSMAGVDGQDGEDGAAGPIGPAGPPGSVGSIPAHFAKYRGVYNQDTHSPALTDAGGGASDFYIVEPKPVLRVQNFGTGPIVFLPGVGGLVVHDGTSFAFRRSIGATPTATMVAGNFSDAQAPTDSEVEVYVTTNNLSGPAVVKYDAAGTATSPQFAWFIDGQRNVTRFPSGSAPGGSAPQTIVWSEASHGLVDSDVGKPLSGSVVWDCTTPNQIRSGVLVSRTSDSITFAAAGQVVLISVASRIAGGSLIIGPETRLLFFNSITGLYETSLPSVAYGGCPPALLVLAQVGEQVRCLVL